MRMENQVLGYIIARVIHIDDKIFFSFSGGGKLGVGGIVCVVELLFGIGYQMKRFDFLFQLVGVDISPFLLRPEEKKRGGANFYMGKHR